MNSRQLRFIQGLQTVICTTLVRSTHIREIVNCIFQIIWHSKRDRREWHYHGRWHLSQDRANCIQYWWSLIRTKRKQGLTVSTARGTLHKKTDVVVPRIKHVTVENIRSSHTHAPMVKVQICLDPSYRFLAVLHDDGGCHDSLIAIVAKSAGCRMTHSAWTYFIYLQKSSQTYDNYEQGRSHFVEARFLFSVWSSPNLLIILFVV